MNAKRKKTSDQALTISETSSSLSQRITFFEYMCVFFLIIYAGRANSLFESSSIKNNPVGFIIPILLSGILALRWKVKFDSHFFGLLFGFAIYFLAISIKYKAVHPTLILDYFSLFFIVYVVIKALKFNLFTLYEHILFYLAIIGFLFWCIQVVLGGDTLFYMFNRIALINKFSYVSGGGINAILYTVQPSYTSLLYGTSIPRNSGYAWEPGAFAVYICFALLINLFFNKSEERGNIRFWILLVVLLTTQSTTGYIIFIVIVLYYLLNKRINIIILLLPFAIIATVYLASLPFMSKKVVELIDETKTVDILLENTYGSETSSTPQRFTSFLLTFIDFRNNPLLGVGGNKSETYTYKIGSNISPISGIGNLLAQFGLYGFIFFIVISIKTSRYLSRHYKYMGKYLIFIIIILISVSYSIILLPLVMCFWMFQFFASGNLNETEINSTGLAEDINSERFKKFIDA
jgi:hypothetical protein